MFYLTSVSITLLNIISQTFQTYIFMQWLIKVISYHSSESYLVYESYYFTLYFLGPCSLAYVTLPTNDFQVV